jgi:hypothetical protein
MENISSPALANHFDRYNCDRSRRKSIGEYQRDGSDEWL